MACTTILVGAPKYCNFINLKIMLISSRLTSTRLIIVLTIFFGRRRTF